MSTEELTALMQWCEAVTGRMQDVLNDLESLAGKHRSLTKRVKALEELVLRISDDGR